MKPLPFVAPLLAFVFLVPASARADPWLGTNGSGLEDQWSDGDVDLTDLLEGTQVSRSHGGGAGVRTGSFLTLGGMFRTAQGKQDLSIFLIVGVPFDRIAQGNVHELGTIEQPALLPSWVAERAGVIADPPRSTPHPLPVVPAPPPTPPLPPPAPPPPVVLRITPGVARKAVSVALRASGVGTDDARIDSMISRSRLSAALPETRFRIMKVIDDSSQLGVIPEDASAYDLAGADLYLEARFTWRLDRLVFAEDEPTLERARLERHDARERIATKVVEALFQWQRATVALRNALEGSKEAVDAALRVAEAEAALDVLTAGWFSGWVDGGQ